MLGLAQVCRRGSTVSLSSLRHSQSSYSLLSPLARRYHSLLIGTGILHFSINQHSSSSSSWFPISSCETTSALIGTPNPSPQLTLPQEEISSFWNTLKKSFQWFLDFLRLLKRLTIFSAYLTPTILTSPILLLGSSSLDAKWWQLVRYSIFACGPCLTKFAQWAATRPDIFPTRFCKELELLQSKSYEHSWEETVRIFEEIYGPQWSELLSLDQVSISGSGLVAQVYHGRLLTRPSVNKEGKERTSQGQRLAHINDNGESQGQEVAVKILHPRVRSAMREDLHLLSFLAHSIESTVSTLTYWYHLLNSTTATEEPHEVNKASFLDTTISLRDIVREFDSFMSPQLDLRNEVIAMKRFKRNFQESSWKSRVEFAEPVQFPLPVLKNASDSSMVFEATEEECNGFSSEILLETYLEGVPMAEYLTNRSRLLSHEKEEPRQRKFDKAVAALGLDLILKMVHSLFPPLSHSLSLSDLR
jgi:hypothetical protein